MCELFRLLDDRKEKLYIFVPILLITKKSKPFRSMLEIYTYMYIFALMYRNETVWVSFGPEYV